MTNNRRSGDAGCQIDYESDALDELWENLERHRSAIIASLRTAGAVSDEAKIWNLLKFVSARHHGLREAADTETGDRANSKRIETLGQIANAARKLVRLLKESDVTLSRTWFDTDPGDALFNNFPVEDQLNWKPIRLDNDAEVHLTQFADSIMEIRENFRRTSGPKKAERYNETVLALAHVYRQATGRKAGAGVGPFARFLREFMAAIGDPINSDGSAVNLIKASFKSGTQSAK